MMTNSLDLTNCDREQIHLIASIQGHGTFLSLGKTDLRIRNVAQNLAAFFGKEEAAEAYIGRRLNDLFSMEYTGLIHECFRGGSTLPAALELNLTTGKTLEVHLYNLSADLVGIEFEAYEKAVDSDLATELNLYLEEMQRGKNVSQVAEAACKAVRSITGFDRVMMYRFFPPTMYGEVIAEDRNAESQSFQGHRFPATDIPKPARDLYLRNKVRFIYDGEEKNFGIAPGTIDKKNPLDLSDSRLRSVSAIHLEYLKNMGVRSSMSVAVIVNGQLWGLIACHNSSPLYVSQEKRKLCLQVGNTLAMVAPLMERSMVHGEENTFYGRLYDLFNVLKLEPDPLLSLFRRIEDLNRLFSCGGVALVTPDETRAAGITPRTSDIQKIWKSVKENMATDVYDTEHLEGLHSEFKEMKDEASGVLAIKVSPLNDSMLLFFRPENLFTILWGGDPRKNLEDKNYGGKINPRVSFETWTEVVKGKSLPWKDFEVRGARQFRSLVFDSLVRKEELIGELHQRLKAKA